MKRDPATGAPDFYRFARDYLHTYLPTVARRSPNTIEAYRISLECFLHYLAEHEHIDRPDVSFGHFDRPHRTRDTAVLAAFTGRTAKSRRNRMLLIDVMILLYDTAARVGEITSLTLQDLHLGKPGHVVSPAEGTRPASSPSPARQSSTWTHTSPSSTRARRSVHTRRHGRAPEMPLDPKNIHCHMLRKPRPWTSTSKACFQTFKNEVGLDHDRVTIIRPVDHIDRWSRWRRHHQFRAKTAHYQRRLSLLKVRLEYYSPLRCYMTGSLP